MNLILPLANSSFVIVIRVVVRCLCEHCQIMGREEECACCHEIEQVSNKNQEVNEKIKPMRPFTCITDSPGCHTVCLDIWFLQATWFGYKQQYGSRAYEGPEHKVN